MNDYFARRSAERQGTLNRIDIATAPRCMTCGHMMRGDEPTDLFCSVTCHNAGLRYTADPGTNTDEPVDAWEWRGAKTKAQVEKRDRYRRHFRQQSRGAGTLPTAALLDEWQSYPQEREWFQRVHLNRRTAARPDPGGLRTLGAYMDELPPVSPVDAESALASFREAFRAMTDGLSVFMDRWTESLRGFMPVIEAITDDTTQYNKHLKLPADDPRRAILHHVQNRGTGPAKTPFAKRGRR